MYDPLVDASPLSGQSYPASYWAAQHMPPWPARQELPSHADVVVIGGGYTGLNAAWELSERYQRDVVVVEANAFAWGCSGRNAGFVMASTGRLGYQQWQQKFGRETALGVYQEHQQALRRVRNTIEQSVVNVDCAHGGYLKLAHNASMAAKLKDQQQWLAAAGDDACLLNGDELMQFIRTPIASHALHFPQTFAVNPLQLAAATAERAAQAGVTLVSDACVNQFETLRNDKHVLHTSAGTIQSKQVIIASNGYTPNHLHPSIHGRSLPVLSSIIVTPPLSIEQQRACGLSSAHQFMDTRALKYYFRLLPDGRLLFGGRGAISGKNADNIRFAKDLQQALLATFPKLRESVAGTTIDYFWSGWISVALDDYPRIYEAAPNIYTSMGYCGAGVAFSALAGMRLAQLAAGESLPPLPYYQSALSKFPFAGARRLGQWAYYQLMSGR